MILLMYWLMCGLMCGMWLFSASCKLLDIGRADRRASSSDRLPINKDDRPGEKIYLPGSHPPAVPPEGPIQIGLEDAILLALENNRSLIVERLTPLIRRTKEDEERARFTPSITGGFGISRERSKQLARSSSVFSDNTGSEFEVDVGISQYFSTGTEVEADISTRRTWSDWYSDQHKPRVGVSVTQALLRGAGTDVNLVRLRQSKLDTRASRYELRGFAEVLVAQVEKTYWEYALSLRRIEIYEESMKLARQQFNETKDIISVGKLAETELTSAQAEIALRRQELIDARSAMETTRLHLLRLLSPPGSNRWQREILLLNLPAVPEATLDDVKAHVGVALGMRPDLNQARLSINRGELEIVKTKNGLLPRLDVFVTLGKTGYSNSFDRAISDIAGDNYDALAGVKFQYPFGNRGALAENRRARLNYDQAVEAVQNLVQLVEVDVRSAYIEVNRAKEQISATTATRKLQEEKLRIETEKFRVGRSTNLLVAQAQRDLVSSQISEVQAAVNYLKALIELYRLEGSLLERRGISAPGRDRVKILSQ